MEQDPEVEAMIAHHQIDAFRSSPVLDAICGNFVLYGINEGTAFYAMMDNPTKISSMQVGNLLNYVGKTKVSEAKVGNVETREVSI